MSTQSRPFPTLTIASIQESKKQRGLTHKERALVRNLSEGKNLTESALAAGYSSKCPGQSGWQALQNIRAKMPELLDQHGLSDEALIEKHLKPLLGAKETKFFQHRGKVTDSRRVPAHAIRLGALHMAFRLRGSYPAPAHENRERGAVEVIVVDVQRPQNRLGDPDSGRPPSDGRQEMPVETNPILGGLVPGHSSATARSGSHDSGNKPPRSRRPIERLGACPKTDADHS